MQLEIPEINREAEVTLIEQNGNSISIEVDGRNYELDVLKVNDGVYSILYKGKSFNVETIAESDPKKHIVNTIFSQYAVEVVDAATRYQRARQGGESADGDSRIVVPMPGKIVKVMAKAGQEVSTGDTLVIVSAMKMESEYKAGKDGVVKEVLVKDGDTVDGGQVMVVLD